MRSTYHPSPPATTQPETAATTGLAQHACLTWSASRPGRGFGFRLGRRVEGCAKELELISWLNNAIVRWESCARNQSEAPHLYTAHLAGLRHLPNVIGYPGPLRASAGLARSLRGHCRRICDWPRSQPPGASLAASRRRPTAPVSISGLAGWRHSAVDDWQRE
jgi:hypothetical protein